MSRHCTGAPRHYRWVQSEGAVVGPGEGAGCGVLCGVGMEGTAARLEIQYSYRHVKEKGKEGTTPKRSSSEGRHAIVMQEGVMQVR